MLKKITLGLMVISSLSVASYAADDCEKYLEQANKATKKANYYYSDIQSKDKYRELALVYSNVATANFLAYNACQKKK